MPNSKVYFVFGVNRDGFLLMFGQYAKLPAAEDRRREVGGIIVEGRVVSAQ